MAENEVKTLSAIFDSVLSIYSDLENSNEKSDSKTFQDKVKQAVRTLEDVTRKVSTLNIFSTNEELDEIPTEDVRFLLLPALLGSLTLKVCSADRLQILDVAEVYYKDFLKRCREYGISDTEISSSETTSSNPKQLSLSDMSKSREEKIRRYKEKKRIQEELADLKKAVENDTVDEEVRRVYYLTFIKLWITQTVEDLASIDMEKPIVEHMAMMKSKSNKEEATTEKREIAKALKPIIITKNAVQKKVFGMGYPSLPTMSVDEFYEQKVKEGTFSVPDMSLQALALGDYDRQKQHEADEIKKEQEIDNDDIQALKTTRAWDDWKDEHRRGWGNRKNMG